VDLFDTDDSDLDLEELAQIAERDADLIGVFLDQIDESDDAKWQLSKWPAENSLPHFNVKGVESLQQRGYNIYRLRPLGARLRKFRILYAYDAVHDDFYLLAVVVKNPGSEAELNAMLPGFPLHKTYNYEPDHPITQRICERYDGLQIPRTRR